MQSKTNNFDFKEEDKQNKTKKYMMKPTKTSIKENYMNKINMP